MKFLTSVTLIAIASLTGCASTLRANVTTYQAWPADVPDTSYVFERTKAKDDSLEYRNTENLVRSAVRNLGFSEAEANKKPSLKITVDFDQKIADVRTIQPVAIDPYFYGGGFYGSGFFGGGAFRHGYYGSRFGYGYPGYGYPGFGYDPYFYGPPAVAYQDVTYQVARRQLHVLISRYLDGKAAYDVTVNSQGQNLSLATVMPYLVRGAFADFPAKNGVTRTIDMKMDN